MDMQASKLYVIFGIFDYEAGAGIEAILTDKEKADQIVEAYNKLKREGWKKPWQPRPDLQYDELEVEEIEDIDVIPEWISKVLEKAAQEASS